MASRPKAARAKRRGHVQQYSTGSGTNESSFGAQLSSAPPPPSAINALPRTPNVLQNPNFPHQNDYTTEEPVQEAGKASDHGQDHFGVGHVATAQDAYNTSRSVAQMENHAESSISHLTTSTPLVMQMSSRMSPLSAAQNPSDARDPWDEDLDDIPWDEEEEEPPQQSMEEPREDVSSAWAVESQPPAQNILKDTSHERTSSLENNEIPLDNVLWDDEQGSDSWRQIGAPENSQGESGLPDENQQAWVGDQEGDIDEKGLWHSSADNKTALYQSDASQIMGIGPTDPRTQEFDNSQSEFYDQFSVQANSKAEPALYPQDYNPQQTPNFEWDEAEAVNEFENQMDNSEGQPEFKNYVHSSENVNLDQNQIQWQDGSLDNRNAPGEHLEQMDAERSELHIQAFPSEMSDTQKEMGWFNETNNSVIHHTPGPSRTDFVSNFQSLGQGTMDHKEESHTDSAHLHLQPELQVASSPNQMIEQTQQPYLPPKNTDGDSISDELTNEELRNDSAISGVNNGHFAAEQTESTVEDSKAVSFEYEQTNHDMDLSMRSEHRSKALELLDLDDDLLLDDDFLDEEPPKNPSVQPHEESISMPQDAHSFKPVTKSLGSSFAAKYSRSSAPSQPSNHYMLSGPVSHTTQSHASPNDVAPEHAVPGIPATAKREKYDAYDFPADLVKPVTKPASRMTPKFSAQPPELTQQQPKTPQTNGENVHNESKSFFEELPTTLPKPGNKARRAASTATAPIHHLPPQSTASQDSSNSLPKKSPKNPYASLAPQSRNSSFGQSVAEKQDSGNAPKKYLPPGASTSGANAPPPVQLGSGFVPPQIGITSTGSIPPNKFPEKVSTNTFSPQQNNFIQPQNETNQQSNTPFPPANKNHQKQYDITSPRMNKAETKIPRVNVNMSKNTEKSNSLSPYVPNTGPYGPPVRTHSRANSLIGANAKEGNPYAPAVDVGLNASPGQQFAALTPPSIRKRGKSIGRTNLPTISQHAPKIEKPENFSKRQFPIFNWGPSEQVVCFTASQQNFGYEGNHGVIKIMKSSELCTKFDVHIDFPGPLSKSKTKRKSLESWLEKNITKLNGDYMKTEELLINEVLLTLVQNEGDLTSEIAQKRVASFLTPNVDFSFSQGPNTNFPYSESLGLSANAFKLDNAGVGFVWSLIQAGNREEALNYTISKQDWSFAFIIAHSLGTEAFSRVCADYARISFPFQTNQNTKVQHLMPILLKIFVGNVKSVIDDFNNVPSEAEFAKSHYREIISAVVVNGVNKEFLVEFGNFLGTNGLACASELCFMLAGIILSKIALKNGAVFSYVGSFTQTSVYSEIYEYILSTMSSASASIPTTGLPDLIQAKIRRGQVLADAGAFSASRKYCDHISGVLKTLGKSPAVTTQMSSEFKNLVVRLTEYSGNDSGWLGGKLSKVNLDKVWGQLDKFIGGEDLSSKPSEKGVFSKFSPSVSRNTSVVDVTLIGGHSSDMNYGPSHTMSAPPTEFSSPSQIPNRAARLQKYAPQIHSSAAKPHNAAQSTNAQNSTSGNSASGKYLPGNLSSSSLNLQDLNTAIKGHTNIGQNSISGQAQTANARNQIYTNRVGHLSSSSINSQNSFANNMTAPMKVAKAEMHTERSTHASPKNEIFSNMPKNNSLHSRDSSINSVISEENALRAKTEYLGPSSPLAETEVSEVRHVVEAETDEIRRNSDSQNAEKGENLKKPEISIEQKDLSTPPVVSRSSGQRSNPYAPGAQKTGIKRNNRYGPLSSKSNFRAIKTESKSADDSLAGSKIDTEASEEPKLSLSHHEKQEVQENASSYYPEAISIPTTSSVGQNEIQPKRETHQDYPTHHPQRSEVNHEIQKSDNTKETFTPVPKRPIANIDVSFDNGRPDDNDDHNEEDRSPLRLNTLQVGVNHDLGGFNQDTKRNGRIRIHGSFDEFPIPGTPEYTTRANSVIGNTGLYSSRLSQSQQSAMYQQYEVKDDTVVDYIPIPDEDDEDSERKKMKKEARKKDMEEAKHKIQEEMRKRGGGQNADNGWFKGWLGNKRNDDKPKPIKAKLGQANTFKYDEKHKRWIDTSRPLEEQLKEAAPPPPPKKRIHSDKKDKDKPDEIPANPGSANNTSDSPLPAKIPNAMKPGSKPSETPKSSKPNLAHAGLDDLLSLTNSNLGSAPAGRKTKRRYVNVMDKK